MLTTSVVDEVLSSVSVDMHMLVPSGVVGDEVSSVEALETLEVSEFILYSIKVVSELALSLKDVPRSTKFVGVPMVVFVTKPV